MTVFLSQPTCNLEENTIISTFKIVGEPVTSHHLCYYHCAPKYRHFPPRHAHGLLPISFDSLPKYHHSGRTSLTILFKIALSFHTACLSPALCFVLLHCIYHDLTYHIFYLFIYINSISPLGYRHLK